MPTTRMYSIKLSTTTTRPCWLRPALAYLKQRGLEHPDLITKFKLGYANRTLGLRLPVKQNQTGEQIRAPSPKVGLHRESGLTNTSTAA